MRRRLLTDTGPRAARWIFWLAVAAFVVFSLLDVVTTSAALAAGGREGNPIAARVFHALGNGGLLAFKSIVVAIIIAVLVLAPRRVLSLRVATYVAAVFAAVMATVVMHNVQAYASLVQRGHACTYHSASGKLCAPPAPANLDG